MKELDEFIENKKKQREELISRLDSISEIIKEAEMERAKYLIGKTIIFPQGNSIDSFQDFTFYNYSPPSIKFTIESVNSEKIWLKAPKYGEIGNYGNGQIAVYYNDIKHLL